MTIGSDLAMTESKTAKRLSTYLTKAKFNGFWLRRSASNECCHARSTMVGSKVGNSWTAEAGLHNDEEVVSFDVPDVVGWFSVSVCKRRLYRASCCWQVHWNWEISWVTAFPCYDQCLNCIKKSVLSWKKPYQIVIQKFQVNNLAKCRRIVFSKFEEHSVAPVVGPNF